MNQEKELVALAKGRDERAFERLVVLYEKKIYAMGLRYTGNSQDAMDIVQEVFLRVFRFIGRFNEESSFSTWLYRIAVNVCKDTVAKKQRLTEVPFEIRNEDGEYETEVADLRFSPESEQQRSELREQIIAGIEALPEKYREIIVLRDIGGLSYENIAQALDLEAGTVKSRIARARERLRVYLSHNGNIRANGQS